jgi:Multiubiquitin
MSQERHDEKPGQSEQPEGQHDHHDHEHREHEVTIIVNGKEKHWSAERISYDQLVKLSGEPLPPGPDPGFTITYFDGPHDKPEGSVTEGHSVKVKNHMVFNVTPTNRS